jgi:hypothetical protein
MVESPRLGISEQPGGLLDRDVLVFQVTKGEAVSQMVQDFPKTASLLGKAPPE